MNESRQAGGGRGALRGRESCAAFQAEGTPCPNARKRESPHGTVFGFVAAENVREDRDKAGTGTRTRVSGIMGAKLLK